MLNGRIYFKTKNNLGLVEHQNFVIFTVEHQNFIVMLCYFIVTSTLVNYTRYYFLLLVY